MKRLTMLAMLAACLVVFGCAEPSGKEIDAPDMSQKPVICVSNYPLLYFVERIAGPLVEPRFAADVPGDPAYWKPSVDDIATMQQADLIILNGASYETWLANVTLPQSRLVDSAEGFRDRLMPLEESVTHSHGPEGDHEHQGTAFTTWLDLSLAVEQAGVIADALAAHMPQYQSQFEDRFRHLQQELEALDAEIQTATGADPGGALIFSHPVYQYFQRRYGVQGRSVHWEPNAMPDDAMWQDLQQKLQDQPAKWMVWESQPLPEIADKLRSMGIKSTVVDPCGNRPAEGDFLSAMRENLREVKRIYQQ